MKLKWSGVRWSCSLRQNGIDEQFHYVVQLKMCHLFSLNIYSVNLGNGRYAYHLPVGPSERAGRLFCFRNHTKSWIFFFSQSVVRNGRKIKTEIIVIRVGKYLCVCLFNAAAHWGIKQGDMVSCFSGLTRN